MMNYFSWIVITSSILCKFVLPSSPDCWEENQMNHKLDDLKGNEEIFNHIAYGLEEGQVGKKGGGEMFFRRFCTSFRQTSCLWWRNCSKSDLQHH